VDDIWQDRTLALAGIFQAARLTQQLAREGRTSVPALRASVQSLFRLDAATTAEVYGGSGGVALGLKVLRERLSSAAGPLDFELARYVVNLLQLERTFARADGVQQAILEGLRAIESQMKFFANGEDTDGVHPRLSEKLGELYQQTLSVLSPRIMVSGEHGHLANPHVAAQVRAALFAGVRSAHLWRQKGGSRWHLLLLRRRMVTIADRLLEDAKGN
jgi:high frequency lysogenization protein